jgi:hypothetical protein
VHADQITHFTHLINWEAPRLLIVGPSRTRRDPPSGGATSDTVTGSCAGFRSKIRLAQHQSTFGLDPSQVQSQIREENPRDEVRHRDRPQTAGGAQRGAGTQDMTTAFLKFIYSCCIINMITKCVFFFTTKNTNINSTTIQTNLQVFTRRNNIYALFS